MVFFVFWSILQYAAVTFVAFLILGAVTSIIFFTHINLKKNRLEKTVTKKIVKFLPFNLSLILL